MIRTGAQCLDSFRDGRQVWINGECKADMTTHPAFRPIVSLRARLYDLAHAAQHSAALSYIDDGSGESCNLALTADPFYVSANADPEGDRSKRPQDQHPDMLLHVVKETDAGIVVRVYMNFDFDGPLRFAKQAAGLSNRVP